MAGMWKRGKLQLHFTHICCRPCRDGFFRSFLQLQHRCWSISNLIFIIAQTVLLEDNQVACFLSRGMGPIKVIWSRFELFKQTLACPAPLLFKFDMSNHVCEPSNRDHWIEKSPCESMLESEGVDNERPRGWPFSLRVASKLPP